MKKNKKIMFSLFIGLCAALPTYADPGEEDYSSFLVNQSDQGTQPYVLVKTRTWPGSGCIMASGQASIAPGEKTELVISKKKGCEQAGVGYSLYKKEDTEHTQLLGYVSHRFRDGQFSLQVSMFCKGKQCVFKDLNPIQ